MSLPIALGVRMRAKKKAAGGESPAAKESDAMACGGPVFDHKDLAHAVIKKMSGGGEVEPEDDFLSSDADTEINSVGMPDDSDERADEMAPKSMLKSIMAKRRK